DVAQQAQLVEVAQSLRTDVDSPVQFAFTVSQPAGLQLAQAQPFTAGEEGGASQLWFAADPGPVALPLDGTRAYVVVSAGYSSVEPPVQNATVGGRPAYVLDEADYYRVELLDGENYVVSVSVFGAHSRELFSASQANDLVLTVQTLGTWQDRTQWTDSP